MKFQSTLDSAEEAWQNTQAGGCGESKSGIKVPIIALSIEFTPFNISTTDCN
jgi:hypothetical protein